MFGAAIGILYFGIGASHIFGGQTAGKRLMGIAVLRPDGSRLSIPAGLGRATVLMLPVMFNGLALPIMTSWIGTAIATVLVFGLGSSILYLFLFNRATRQATHDFAAGSIVTRVRNGQGTPVRRPVWRGHFVAVAVILAVMAIGGGIAAFALRRHFDFDAIRKIQEDVATLAHTPAVQVFDGSQSMTGRERETWVRASVMTYASPPDSDRLANGIASIILRDFPAAKTRSTISVTITTGYDIVFATVSNTRGWNYTPAEWQTRIAGE